MMYPSSRDLFEAAREASIDAERISKQLEELDEQAVRVGSPSFDARGRSRSDSDAIGRRVALKIDRQKVLEKRLDEDYQLIDSACIILYGEDGISDGLATLAPAWWADAIYHHFLALRTWEETASLLCYSPRRVYECVRAAFEVMDANGMTGTIGGRGMAEG